MSKQLDSNGLEIAVVGMSLRLPHCATVDAFWQSLSEGKELIKFYDDQQLLDKGVDAQLLGQDNYVKAGGFIDKPFQFDADFFDYVPREAQYMDPQLRLLHEVSWQALQDASCLPNQTDGDIGLYCGSAQNISWLNLVAEQVGSASGEFYELQMLCKREFFNTRLAYNLNLTGPAVAIDSTCSTSLVAIHMASQGLLSGDCDVALAGGVCVGPQVKGYSYHEGMIQSPDGHCRPFDAKAKGTVPGNGLGMVVLKRLEEAIEEGDKIYAVIKGSAINNDGNAKPGYTSPSVKGQKRVIEKTLDIADVNADEIDFVECHGTATTIGDPIEVEALLQAFNQNTGDKGKSDEHQSHRCYIGSVKSNVGHLDAAAGVIGFIKAALALQNSHLPASLHYQNSNENIDFNRGFLTVNDTYRTLENEHRPLRGGVSSFGIGGTNAHVLLEEYVEQRQFHSDERRWEMLPFSAKSDLAAQQYEQPLASFLAQSKHPLADIAASMQNQDGGFNHRQLLLAKNGQVAAEQLTQHLGGRFYRAQAQVRTPALVFMFAGQGGQYLKMSADLYQHQRGYQQLVEQCFALLPSQLLPSQLSQTLRALLLETNGQHSQADALLLAQTDYTQPLLFIVEYAMASYLIELGVEPDVMVGHSVGEYVAACIAGVFSLEDALALVVERGRLMASAPKGAMLSVSASVNEVEHLLSAQLELAAYNAADLIVLSGTADAVKAAMLALEKDNIKCRKLHTSHGYHSFMMDGILAPFQQRCAQVSMQAPSRKFYSNVTGQLITAEQATSPEYWVGHMRGTVNFSDAVDDLLSQQSVTFVEIGPGNALATFVRYNANFSDDNLVVNTIRHPKEPVEDDLVFSQCLAQLYCQGYNLDWQAYNNTRQCRAVSVPLYTFEPREFAQIGGQNQRAEADKKPAQQAKAKPVAISYPRPALSSAMVAPRDHNEQKLAQFWRTMFTLDEVGVNDNFFELGGHSLLAVRVLGQVNSELNAQLQVSDVFEKPTIAELVSLALCNQDDGMGIPSITLISREQPIKASFQQRRLWLIDQIEGDSWQYNMPSSLVVRGHLDLVALQKAVDLLVARHEVLRTNFVDVDGEPHLVVRDAQSVVIDYQDISELAKDQRDSQMQQLVDADAMSNFDLANDLMLRLSVVHLDDDEHLLLFNVHHIASDGWSEIIMIKEFGIAYSAFSEDNNANQVAALPDLSLQYPDFAAWQRDWLSGDVLDAEVDFWTEQLQDLPMIHELPLDKPRPAQQTFNGEVFRRNISTERLAKLKQISSSQGVTLFMTVQTIFALVLSRWSNQEDIVMGTPIAGRTDKSLESLIGFFVNTLILRNDLSGDPDFNTLLQRTKAMALKAFSHQHVPFEMLVDRLINERSPSYSPLFQVLFALQSYERSSLTIGDLNIEKLSGKVSAKFDLTLLTAESNQDGLLADWYFNTDLFEQATIERMADHFELLIDAICLAKEGQHQGVFNLPMLTASEQQLITAQTQLANQAINEAPTEPVHRLFEQQAALNPHAAAVVGSQGESWSYQRLNQQANQLARHMLASGVVNGARVAIAIERSEQMILAIIAVLKTGAAYVPVDPSYPQDRIDYMLKDSGASVLLTTSGVVSRIQCEHTESDPIEYKRAVTLLVDDHSFENYAEHDLLPSEAMVGKDDLAYMIYTSGSTGNPKSVVIAQQQLASSLAARLSYYQLPVQSYLLLSSISFDSSVAGIFWTLCSGGQLVVPSDSQIKDPQSLLEIIDQHKVSHLLCVPSLYRYLLDTAPVDNVSSLQAVILAGEALPPTLRQRHFEHHWSASSDLFNEYGPTEGTVWSSVYQCHSHDNHETVPIGVSPGHAALYVLNQYQQPVPSGVNGELYIGGAGLANEYWHRQDLTDKAFVEVMIGGQQQRLYRSGDLVRWNKQQQLDFVGRVDHQVKVNGYRIETTEVQSVIQNHEQVNQALVLAKDERLVAYYQCHEVLSDEMLGDEASEIATEQAIKAHCMKNLPNFAVPSVWVALAQFPLTTNGKVDRKRLPEPVAKVVVSNLVNHEHNLSTNAEYLQSLWCQLLGASDIGGDDNFFRLGGDSILVLKLKAMLLREGFNFNVPAFYRQPTINALEVLLENKKTQAQQQAVVGEQLLMPAQRWFFELEQQHLHHFNQAVMLTCLQGAKPQLLTSTIEAVVSRHDALRLSFVETAQGWQGQYRPINKQMIEQMVAVRALSDSDEVEALAASYQASLELDGPLFKALLIQLADGSSRVLLIAHHLLIDGVSWRIVLADLMSAYEQAQQGQKIQLGQKSTSLQRWAKGLNDAAQLESVTQELAYWRSQLDKPVSPIRYNLQGSNKVADQQSVSLSFDHEVTQQLLTETRRAYNIGIEALLLAGLSEALYRWQGLKQVRLLLENHGRDLTLDELDVSATVGWFTALYPLHLTHAGGLHEQLNATKRQVTQVPAKGANLGVLRYHTELLPEASRCSQGDLILFNYLGQFDQSIDQKSLFTMAQEKMGPLVSEERQRDNLMSFDGLISQGQLKFTLRFSEQQLSLHSMEALIEQFKHSVESLVAHCANTATGQYSPVDFPQVNIGEQKLADIQRVAHPLKDIYPATPTQQGMAYHSMTAHDSGDHAYTNQIYFDLHGELVVDAFAKAWRNLVADNDIFRTALVALDDGNFVQALYHSSDFEFNYFSSSVDGQQRSVEQIEAAFEQHKAQDQQRGFDLSQPCLMRVSVWQLASNCYRILWTNHHTVMDGWSIPLVFNDVLRHYHNDLAVEQNDSLAIAARPSFKHYIDWLSEQDKTQALTFWQDELAGVNRGCLLAGDVRSQHLQDDNQANGQDKAGAVGEAVLALSEQHNQQLLELSQSQGITPASLVQMAWGYLLSQYTGDEQVVFGTTISGRPADLNACDQIIGSFINTVPVALNYQSEQNLAAFMQTVHTSHAQREANGYLPLSQLNAITHIGHSQALFNTLVVFENYPVEGVRHQANHTGALSTGAICSDESTGYDLTLVVMPGDTLRFKLLYRCEVFSQERIEQYLNMLENILLNCETSLALPMDQLQLLDTPHSGDTDDELEQLLAMADEQELAQLMAEIAA